MQAYVQRSDLNLAREIAPNGKELLGIVLFSKKFELKHEFLYYQEMPDTMQLDCFCSWNPSFIRIRTAKNEKKNAWQKCIFSFLGISISLGLYINIIWFPSCIPSDCIGKRCRKFSPSTLVIQNSAPELHRTAPFYWCGAV